MESGVMAKRIGKHSWPEGPKHHGLQQIDARKCPRHHEMFSALSTIRMFGAPSTLLLFLCPWHHKMFTAQFVILPHPMQSVSPLFSGGLTCLGRNWFFPTPSGKSSVVPWQLELKVCILQTPASPNVTWAEPSSTWFLLLLITVLCSLWWQCALLKSACWPLWKCCMLNGVLLPKGDGFCMTFCVCCRPANIPMLLVSALVVWTSCW